jgi:hypothetical protein
VCAMSSVQLKKPQLSAARIQAIIAAGVAEPSLLASWRRDPSALTRLGLEPEALEFGSLWRFVGLATKVRYNDLRRAMPLTFRLMDQLGISIGIFADYAVIAVDLRRLGKTSCFEKLSSFLDFVADWIRRDDRDHVLLWDMIRHERELISPIELRPQTPLADALGGQRVLSHCYGLSQQDMSCAPGDLAALIRSGTRDFSILRRGEFHFAYWHSADEADLRILELDELSNVILGLADGERSASEIARICASATGGEADAVEGCIDQLIRLGLLVESGL